MARTRKNANGKATSPSTENQTGQQIVNNKHEQTELNDEEQQNLDDEDAIKNNLIKLTNDNLNSINNGKTTDLHNFIENEKIIENKNISLINGFKEMKMSTNSTFVFSQTSNETFTPGAN